MAEIPDRIQPSLADKYQISHELGRGGMATVYLARDLKHDRDVALKVLHPELGAILGADRFLAEIKLTASLQHPNILPLFDSGEADGLLYYVMPYIEGESLRGKLDREGPLPVEDAIRVASQVANALDYAHRHGVIHRDIKPENILVHDGQALVADFGIALAVKAAGGTRLTETGLSLGTPQYMSPEQATAERELDARSDVYSLGCVAYELFAGEAPFSGPSAQAILAKIVTADPPLLSEKRRSVPDHVVAAIHRAIEKLPGDRWNSAAEFATALTEVTGSARSYSGATRPVTRPGQLPRFLWPLVTAAALIGAVLAWATRQSSEEPLVVRFSFQSSMVTFRGSANTLALSPDGKTIVFVAPGERGWPYLYQRRIDQLRATVVAGSGGAGSPAISPDGESVAFVDNSDLEVVPLAGGQARILYDSAAAFGGVDWGFDGYVYFAHRGGEGISRVASSGGAVEHLTRVPEDQPNTLHRNPRLLPGGKAMLYTVWASGAGLRNQELRVMVLDSGESRVLLPGASGWYLPTGHLLVIYTDGSVHLAPFDLDALEVTGSPRAANLDVGITFDGSGQFALSATGNIAYLLDAGSGTQPVWISEDGEEEPLALAVNGALAAPELSPDGRQFAVDQQTDTGTDIWLYHLEQGTFTRQTFVGGMNMRADWLPDGESFAFSSDRGGNRALYLKRADGSGEARLLAEADRHLQEISWLPDGRGFYYREGFSDATTNRDIMFRTVEGDSSITVFGTGFDELNPMVSPDGSWLAYVSDESGQDEVFLTATPGAGGRTQISTNGGSEPRWGPSSRTLYFRSSADSLVKVTLSLSGAVGIVERRNLFSMAGYLRERNHTAYDVAADGRILAIKESGTTEVGVVINWLAELGDLLTSD